jgi:hypothetical protein
MELGYMSWEKWSKRKTIYTLEGIRLRSCRLWLDENGFHPFLDQNELTRPDLQKSMGCKYDELPKEAWEMMDKYDNAIAKRSKYAT